MKPIVWDQLKNEKLKAERGIGFEEIEAALEEHRVLTILKHVNPQRYPGQQFLIVEINAYAYMVPFVEDNTKLFLKTIIPSRDATKKYLRGSKHE